MARLARKAGAVVGVVALLGVVLLLAGSSASRAAAHEDGETAYLGVQIREETEHPEGGARVTQVVEDSPAGEAGVEEGDIIVEFAGEVIRGPRALTERIHAKQAGDRVTVVVLRDRQRLSLEVELGERSEVWAFAPYIADPEQIEGWGEQAREMAERWREQFEDYNWEQFQPDTEQMEKLQEQAQEMAERWSEKYENWAEYMPKLENWGYVWSFGRPKLGVQLAETTPELREHLGGSEEAGVLVSKVLSDTPAEKAGIQVGDLILSVNGGEVASTAELVGALVDKDGPTIELEVVRDGRKLKLQADILEPDEDESAGPRAARDARREALAAQLGAQREARRMAREDRRAAIAAQLDVQRAARQAESAAAREALRHAVEARREAEREQRQRVRDLRRKLREAAGTV